MLNTYQQEKYDWFWESINNKTSWFYNAKDRAVGKTYLINEIGLELQALGYRVYIVSPVNCIEYFAERKISLDSEDFRGRLYEGVVVLLDEVFMSENLVDFINYCESRNVPAIGFVRYPQVNRKPVDFEKEYECKWIR